MTAHESGSATHTLPGLDRAVLDRGGVRVDRDGVTLWVTLDRPGTRNAQTPATWHALRHVGAALDRRDTIRVVVLRGNGPAFSSGLDRRMLGTEPVDGQPPLTALLARTDDEVAAEISAYQEGFSWLRRADVVTVAAVHGHAIGAGFQLALACDLRVLAEDAQLSMRETALGLVPDLTGTKPLVEAVGYARALEICATGRPVGAAEALELGLATVVVARDQLDAAVDDLVGALTAAPAGAVAETKALLQAATGNDAATQRRREREAQVRRFRALAADAVDAVDMAAVPRPDRR
ncbi:MAG TPA: enoyl-CoA hydratase/isomerase family protein [Nocardioidaceae bacterium]|jgi:enoyl-CoA hydratase/carnithine racemase|nr:enoyl-CoA hydratase/isomerase family protein [Nocardioidaceae bacterium]